MTNRRILKQHYLDTTTRAGVYAIRNRITGRKLVAGSSDVQGTLNRHRFELRQGSHRNRRMREDWDAHGEASFTFDVLDRLEPCDDAGFDAARELDELVALWRQELPCAADGDYASSGIPS